MAELLCYVSKKELGASAQVRNFIEFYRELNIFGDDISWNDSTWDITKTHPIPGRNNSRYLAWYKMPKTKGLSSKEPMSKPFGDFARAWICYLQNATQRKCFDMEMITLRILEKALLDRSPDGEVRIERVDMAVLDHCVEVIREHYSITTHYDRSSSVAKLSRELEQIGLVTNPTHWCNPIPPKQDPYCLETDDAIVANRNKKLPTESAFVALLEIFAKRDELTLRDQIITSMAILLVSAPQRGSENANVWAECGVWRELPGNEPEFCLRWFPVKGGSPQIKPIPKTWAPATEEALRRLRQYSEKARIMARWYEKHPDKIYLPPGYDHFRDKKWLTSAETQDLLGLTSSGLSKLYQRCNDNDAKQKSKIPNEIVLRRESDPEHRYPSANRYYFKDIERYILCLIPTNFPVITPFQKMRYSDSLSIFPTGLAEDKRKYQCRVMFSRFDATALYDALGSASKMVHLNLFARHGYFDEKGNPLYIAPHSFRHMLTTMAQEAGSSQYVQTQWRGSKSLVQTEAYNHMTSDEKMKRCNMVPEEGTICLDVDNKHIQIIAETEIAKFHERGFQLHANEFGICAHEIIQAPCPRYKDCINCTEQICVVGDEEKTRRIELIVQHAEQCLSNALQDKEDDIEEADLWVEQQRRTIENGTTLLEVLHNKDIPPGTYVKRTRLDQHEPFLEAASARAELTGTKEDWNIIKWITPLSLPKEGRPEKETNGG
ncbi:MAG: hypothetical protein JRG71_05620 [Deltaproteobacteria bacterium]|nr:hypothetical protein [Deltaproteobacteria bacterium]